MLKPTSCIDVYVKTKRIQEKPLNKGGVIPNLSRDPCEPHNQKVERPEGVHPYATNPEGGMCINQEFSGHIEQP